MKRSKIYLGITTGLLAIVGVAAAKAHKFSAHFAGAYGTFNANNSGLNASTCLHQSAIFYTAGNVGAYTQKVVGGTEFPVYTQPRKTECSGVRLFKTPIGS